MEGGGCREARGGRRWEFKERMKGGGRETGMEGREKRTEKGGWTEKREEWRSIP